MSLDKFCFDIDDRHEKLHSSFQTVLGLPNPALGFLKYDCFHPLGIVESFPCMEASLLGMLSIVRKMHEHHHPESQFQLGFLCQYATDIKQLIKENKPLKDEDAEKVKDVKTNLKLALSQVWDFLSLFDYKKETPYKQNLATFLVAKMLEGTQQSRIEQPTANQTLFSYNNQHLSLADIAKSTLTALGKDARNIQYIAIGRGGNGKLVITTNDDAPSIYPIEDVLQGRTHFESVNKARELYRKTHASELKKRQNIHAETMLAALKKQLKINTILVIDGHGVRSQNCIHCALFLQSKLFKSDPHIEEIKNFVAPTKSQLAAATQWYKLRLAEQAKAETNICLYTANFDNYCHDTTEKETAKQVSQKTQKLLTLAHPKTSQNFVNKESNHTQLFHFIKENYPSEETEMVRRKGTYHVSYALAEKSSPTLTRTQNIRGKRTASIWSNNTATLMHEAGFTVTHNTVAPTRPNSPRSAELANMTNQFTILGDGSGKIRVDHTDNNIVASRNPRAMASSQ